MHARRLTLRWGVVGAAAGALLLAMLGSATSAPARAAGAPLTAQLQRSLDEFLRAHRAFTGIALAVRTPSLEWNGATGVTARKTGAPLDPDAPFRIASVTKTFTAAAILRLVEEGKLSLDDPIATHLSAPTVALLAGGGGLVSTVGDLARFYRGLFAGRVFEKRATLATMLQRPRARHATDSMGIFARRMGGETCWGHNGFWGIDAYHCPRSGITIVTTANQALADVHRLHDAVHRLVKRA
jgi:CubicO group peptidase (beta-lactamase class C family)